MIKFYIHFGANKAYKILIYFLVFLPFIFIGCTDTTNLYSINEFRELFDNAGGWTPLPIPDSKYCPGAIVMITDKIKFIDDLTSCKYPLNEFELKSYVPNIVFTKSWELKAEAMINYSGIGAGPEFEKVSKVRVEVQDQGADSFRILKLKVWMQDLENQKKVSNVCMEELLKPNRYLITEAFRVSKGKYTLLDKTGAAVKLKTGIIGNFLKLEPSVKFQITTDGAIVIEQPAYFAIRYAIRVDEGFENLGATGSLPEIGDSKIEKLFYETYNSR